jgi:hypothetical protein
MATMKQMAAGLTILMKYDPEGSCSAEHDILYAGPDEQGKVSEEDQKKLEDLGWHWDEQFDCWARFT